MRKAKMETGKSGNSKIENRNPCARSGFARPTPERRRHFRFSNFDFRNPRRHAGTGQATLEFVLTTLLIVALIFAALDLIMILYTGCVMADAAKEGIRYAVVHGCDAGANYCSGTCTPACADASAANVVTQVKNYAKLSGHNISGITVTVNYPDSSAAMPSRVQVLVSYPYQSYFNLGWKTVTISAAAEGRIAF
jgi:Flp pilus assembly protein TadG